ncbi:MAG TPA: hypothetical protein VLD37_00720 [Candidatus Bilamarchaeum sp.]|nr:hypothetical protein [Candidatus Bilamarchaeum sp.]
MKGTIRVYYEKANGDSNGKRLAAEMSGRDGEFPRGKIFADGIQKLAKVSALNIRARSPGTKTDQIEIRNEIEKGEFDKFKELLERELNN